MWSSINQVPTIEEKHTVFPGNAQLPDFSFYSVLIVCHDFPSLALTGRQWIGGSTKGTFTLHLAEVPRAALTQKYNLWRCRFHLGRISPDLMGFFQSHFLACRALTAPSEDNDWVSISQFWLCFVFLMGILEQLNLKVTM